MRVQYVQLDVMAALTSHSVVANVDPLNAFNDTAQTCTRKYPYYGFNADIATTITSTTLNSYRTISGFNLTPFPRYSTGQLGTAAFTAPVAGYYAFFANMRYDAACANYFRLMIVKNGDNDVANGAMRINQSPPCSCMCMHTLLTCTASHHLACLQFSRLLWAGSSRLPSMTSSTWWPTKVRPVLASTARAGGLEPTFRMCACLSHDTSSHHVRCSACIATWRQASMLCPPLIACLARGGLRRLCPQGHTTDGTPTICSTRVNSATTVAMLHLLMATTSPRPMFAWILSVSREAATCAVCICSVCDRVCSCLIIVSLDCNQQQCRFGQHASFYPVRFRLGLYVMLNCHVLEAS